MSEQLISYIFTVQYIGLFVVDCGRTNHYTEEIKPKEKHSFNLLFSINESNFFLLVSDYNLDKFQSNLKMDKKRFFVFRVFTLSSIFHVRHSMKKITFLSRQIY